MSRQGSQGDHPRVVFIVGAPRSGTTLLEELLGAHPDIADWYEPYYVWERYFSSRADDRWVTRGDPEGAARRIRREYRIFSEKSGGRIIADKLPYYVFNIDTVGAVFPDARWVHILRDGRDVTLSIAREWEKRRRMVEGRDYLQMVRVALRMLRRQPFLRYRLLAIHHEITTLRSLNPARRLNKARWGGRPGWGPRFTGWEEALQARTTLEFNALQWTECVRAAREGVQAIPPERRTEIRYEDLLSRPGETVEGVLKTIGAGAAPEWCGTGPALRRENTGKWKKGFSPGEISLLKPILTPLLGELGYLEQEPWPATS